jgi:hypothetical protein
MIPMLVLALSLGGSARLPAQTSSPKPQTQQEKDEAYDREQEALRKLKHALPSRAKITIGKAQLIPGYSDEMTQEECSAWRLTERQVRRMFRTYHVVIGVEHEGYSEVGCAIDGDILIDGRRYTFSAQLIDNLYTNWPNGTDHRLGAKESHEME